MTDYYVNGDSVGHTVNGRSYGIGNDSNAGTDITLPKKTILDAVADAGDNDDIYICGAVDSFDGVYVGRVSNLEIRDFYSDGVATVKGESGDAQVFYNYETLGSVSFRGDGFILDPDGLVADTFYNRGGGS